jgi:predicted RNA-binding protein YlxR (DUF448 family)
MVKNNTCLYCYGIILLFLVGIYITKQSLTNNEFKKGRTLKRALKASYSSRLKKPKRKDLIRSKRG